MVEDNSARDAVGQPSDRTGAEVSSPARQLGCQGIVVEDGEVICKCEHGHDGICGFAAETDAPDLTPDEMLQVIGGPSTLREVAHYFIAQVAEIARHRESFDRIVRMRPSQERASTAFYRAREVAKQSLAAEGLVSSPVSQQDIHPSILWLITQVESKATGLDVEWEAVKALLSTYNTRPELWWGQLASSLSDTGETP